VSERANGGVYVVHGELLLYNQADALSQTCLRMALDGAEKADFKLPC
jgi:hypothetical protein